MRQYFRIIALAAVASGIVGTAQPAHAAAIPLSGVSLTDLCNAFDCATPVATLVSDYDFEPFEVPPDGVLTSYVFEGLGSNAGIFAYVYEIAHNVGSSEDLISGITIDFFGRTQATVGGAVDAFYVTDGTNVDPVAAAELTDDLRFAFGVLGTGIEPGQQSTWFGAFSTAPSRVVTANLLDSGDEASPDVLAPSSVPEPVSTVLVGFGLLGAGIAARRRR